MKTLKHGNAVASLTGGALMMYDIIVLEDFLFMRRHEDDKPAFSKKLHSGDHFRKSAFLVPENSVYVWTKGQNGEKNLRVRENIRIGVGGTLIACVASVSVLFRESKTARKMAPPPSPSFIFLTLVSFLARPKPRIPFLGLSLLRHSTETLASQARTLKVAVSTVLSDKGFGEI